MHHFDVVLKVLLRNSMARITGRQIVRWLPTELPIVQNLSVDLLGETADGGLMQLEVQSLNDAAMPFRMLRYLGLILSIHDRIPEQVVLYIGRERLTMKTGFEWAHGHLRYAVIDMRDIDGEPLLASPEPSDNVIAILARLKDGPAAVRSVLEKISGLPRDDAKEYYEALLILSGLRGLAKTVQQEASTMFHIDISENEVLGPIYLQGREEGREEGRQEGRHELIALLGRLIQQRIGSLPHEVEQKLLSSSSSELQKISSRVLEATTFDDLFQ